MLAGTTTTRVPKSVTRRGGRLVAVIAGLVAVATMSACIRTVPSVDLSRYQGLWYEIASYETPFNRGLVATTATYTPNPDGSVGVVNRARQGSFDGPETGIEGVARPQDATNSKLDVIFGSVPFSGLFPGQYWVVDLAEDYSYAVVSDPFRATLFVLSRTSTMDPEVYDGILSRLAADGFDIGRLKLTPQP